MVCVVNEIGIPLLMEWIVNPSVLPPKGHPARPAAAERRRRRQARRRAKLPGRIAREALVEEVDALVERIFA